MLTKDELPECPVATTLQLIGGKWKPLVLRNLLQRAWRFNELKNDLAGISHKALTDILRQMESDGIIIRKDYGGFPRKVEYSLSEFGESMRPIIQAMHDFGMNYKQSFKSGKELP